MSEIDVSSLSENTNGESEELAVFVPPTTTPVAGMHGEFSHADVKYPFLSIIQAVGPNSVKFPDAGGKLIYGGETLVPKPVPMSFWGVTKRYRQNLKWDPHGPRPQVFDSAAKVLASGGNLREYVSPGA